MKVEFESIVGDFQLGYISHGQSPKKGVGSGLSGGAVSQFRKTPQGALGPLPTCTQEIIKQDENVVSISCKGGGFENRLERDPSIVANDVSTGLDSIVSAKSLRGCW